MPESTADITQYLVNIILTMRADGKVAQREEDALETVRQDIGAKKTELSQALKAVDAGGSALAKTGRFSDQIRNLEDMLFVRLIDNNLSEAASNLISQFCGQIGISQDQLNQMVQQACDRSHGGEMTCGACGKVVPVESKFCPFCGAAFADSAPVAIEMTIPPTGWAIEFCESTSSNFSHALEIAKASSSFATCQKSKKNWYLAAWTDDRFERCAELADMLGPIRNRRVYRNGSELPWEDVFGFVWCAHQRDQAYQPAEYCFGRGDNRLNLWGCKQARLDWAEWGDWYSFGSFKKSGPMGNQIVWTFDKERIRHELMTNLQRFRYCPHIRSKLIEEVLRALPNEISVNSSGLWKYKQNFEEVPGSIKVVEMHKDGDYSYNQEFYSNGVLPKGWEQLPRFCKVPSLLRKLPMSR